MSSVRIEPHRPHGGDEARNQRDDDHHGGDADQRDRIATTHACEHSLQGLADAERAHEAKRYPDRQLHCDPACDDPPHVLRSCAESKAHAKFPRPLRDREGGDPI